MHDVTYASPAPQRLPDWNPNAGGIEAFYFKDPDGNNLEILQFPEGKGAPKWHAPTGRLFLGIDHTAVVVEDTDASLAFYRDRLGLRVVGRSENWGPEQERLNNVFGARLRIAALRAPKGPGWSSWNISARGATGGRFRPNPGPAISGTGRSICTLPTSTRPPMRSATPRALRLLARDCAPRRRARLRGGAHGPRPRRPRVPADRAAAVGRKDFGSCCRVSTQAHNQHQPRTAADVDVAVFGEPKWSVIQSETRNRNSFSRH